MLLIGRSAWAICFHPIRRTTPIWEMTSNQYGISAVAPQTSFRGRNQCWRLKCRLSSQAWLQFRWSFSETRAQEKKTHKSFHYHSNYYFILLDSPIFWQGLRNCMTQLLLARNSLFPYERPPQRGLRLPLFTNSLGYLTSKELIYIRVVRRGLRFYRPYPRRIKKRPWMLFQPGFEPAAFRSADQGISITDLTVRL